jgi:uncharacterized protein (DUF2252 family)
MTASRAYRSLLGRTSPLPRLDVHYLAFGEGDDLPPDWCSEMIGIIGRERRRAHRRTHERLGLRITDGEDADHFHVDPPVITTPSRRIRESVIDALGSYVGTVSPDIQELLKDYGVLDVAHKVVGVGSVGTRDYIVLLQGNHRGDHLLLQVKEALPSVVRDRRCRLARTTASTWWTGSGASSR